MSRGTIGLAAHPTAVELIAAEQVHFSHDASHAPQCLADVCTASDLVAAAAAYMYTSATLWPFDEAAFQPDGDPVGDLAKAGALIAAALDMHLARIDDHGFDDSQPAPPVPET